MHYSFSSLFPIWMPFICFYCLIAPAKTVSKRKLNRSGGSRHPSLFLVLEWKHCLWLSILLSCSSDSDCVCHGRMSPSSPYLLSVFIMGRCILWSACPHVWDNCVAFVHYAFYLEYYFDWYFCISVWHYWDNL
jgi:hypothetical protein